MGSLAPAVSPAKSSRKNRQFEARAESDGSILINAVPYDVEPIPAGEFGSIAFRLSKQMGDGAVYDVVRTHLGLVECDCPDYEARHRGNGFGCCKHGRALVELGMVAAAGPDESHLAELEPEWSVLPRPDGSGLSPEELARLHRQRDRVVAAYRAAAPEADQVDVRRVATAAAHDALRAVLRARPAAGAVISTTPGVVEMTSPGDTMIVVPVERDVITSTEVVDPLDLEACPPDWPADDEPELEPRLTLPELVELQARRFRSIDSGAGDLMADALAELARVIRLVGASIPGDVGARLEILEREFSEPVEFEPELTSAGRWS